MISPTDIHSFRQCKAIEFTCKSSGEKRAIETAIVTAAIVGSNSYLVSLKDVFLRLNTDIFEALGQRNLSGFIGEIFARFLSQSINGFVVNPHADGRPDLIDVSTKASKEFFLNDCFVQAENGDKLPVRGNLAPYKFGGLEIKTSIGNPISGYKKSLWRDRGLSEFSVGEPRRDYLASITYWGHHTSCKNLVGLYYDYFSPVDRTPQILAAMHSELDPDSDWHAVSVGKAGSKKTSNTSLTLAGKKKLYSNVIAHIASEQYIEKLRAVGLDI